MSVSVNPKETAIVVVDMQEIEYEYISREDDEEFFGPQRNINSLLQRARIAQCSIVHVAFSVCATPVLPLSFDECYPIPQGISPWHKNSLPQSGDYWMIKNTNSLFGADNRIVDVIQQIRTNRRINTLILTGVHTGVCVKDSAQSADKLGYKLIVPRDTTGDMYRDRKIDAINTFLNCGVTVCNSNDIIFE